MIRKKPGHPPHSMVPRGLFLNNGPGIMVLVVGVFYPKVFYLPLAVLILVLANTRVDKHRIFVKYILHFVIYTFCFLLFAVHFANPEVRTKAKRQRSFCLLTGSIRHTLKKNRPFR
jgi:energy-coupling factor transporter transmembrane protein EcfT